MESKIIKNLLKILVFLSAIILISFVSKVEAASNEKGVVLSTSGQDIKVSINPEEGASIASFQIGLKIETSNLSDIKDVSFNWSSKMKETNLHKAYYNKEDGTLNLYVVSKDEQNTGATIDVGTVSITTNKSVKVTVSTVEKTTTASSIGHSQTPVALSQTANVSYTTKASGSQGNTGDGNQGGNSGNSGNSSQGGNSGNSSQGGSSGNNSNSGNGTNSNGNDNSENNDNPDDENNENPDNTLNEEQNNQNDTIDNTEQNEQDSIATGTLPQTGTKGSNFEWILLAIAILGLLIALTYRYTVVAKKRTKGNKRY